MTLPAMCVACLCDQCRTQKAVLSAASSNIPTMLPQMSINVSHWFSFSQFSVAVGRSKVCARRASVFKVFGGRREVQGLRREAIGFHSFQWPSGGPRFAPGGHRFSHRFQSAHNPKPKWAGRTLKNEASHYFYADRPLHASAAT